MAKFLNNPSKVNLLGTNWQLLLESLDFEFTNVPFPPWTVPAGKITDGPSVPSWLDWLTPRSKFMLSGYLHDDLRNKWSTGNAATDGMLRDAVIAEAAQSLDLITILNYEFPALIIILSYLRCFHFSSASFLTK